VTIVRRGPVWGSRFLSSGDRAPARARSGRRPSGLPRGALGGYAAWIVLLHGCGLLGAVLACSPSFALVGPGALAYALGLRHAFDADHIAAIDNATRQLVQRGRDPSGVGFYFSLGHSTIVLALVLGAVVVLRSAPPGLGALAARTGATATRVSGAVLVLLGLGNASLWWDAYRALRCGRAGTGAARGPRGLAACVGGPLFRALDASWHAYPVGVLFGLGFETATEIAVIALSARAASAGAASLPGLLALPVLFAAGMSLVDTADGVFMAAAYRWAVMNPLGHASYNLAVTGLSVVAALGLGVADLVRAGTGPLDVERAGYLLVASFVVLGLLIYARGGRRSGREDPP
jgi:high-affinity nickel-transport protein